MFTDTAEVSNLLLPNPLEQIEELLGKTSITLEEIKEDYEVALQEQQIEDIRYLQELLYISPVCHLTMQCGD